ncbi:hypothetical protein BHE74_00047099 [Ensete ventricosum]|nr:hypothetical protein GW17_00051104 [Ensete ventricosum]RWW46943.1 hypothetical protein BHE74_00047099 [Ensete ventricosum]RZS12578.1 hypothetical protein BHM03_00044044 [Ensete ventricosum]
MKETNQKIVVYKRPRLPREYLRPLIPYLPHFILPANSENTINAQEQKKTADPRRDANRSDRSHAITTKNKSLTYDSWTDRRERRSGLARSSEPTGSEKIPKARSISRTTDAVRRAARISVNEEDLRPRRVREYRAPLAMVVPASGTPR